MVVFYCVRGLGNHAFSNGLNFYSEFAYMQESRSVTTGENKVQGDMLSSRHNTFLCFIISDQIGVPKKIFFLRYIFIVASFGFSGF